MEFIGWLGGVLLAICGVPMAWQSFNEGHSDGVNMMFLQLWFWGEIFVLAYVLVQPELLYPLIANYAFNIVLIAVVLRYKIYPSNG